MGAEDHPRHHHRRGGQQQEAGFTPLETRGGGRSSRSSRVVAPSGEGAELYHMHNGVVESRMMNAAAKRIVQLEQALEESQKTNEQIAKFYEEKMAKLHKSQMYSVDRMGKRIDVLEAELMSRTVELTRTQQELGKAVEKVVTLQQEIATMSTPTPSHATALLFSGFHTTSTATTSNTDSNRHRGVQERPQQEHNQVSTTKRRNDASAEERSYPSSAGSEGQFVVQHHPEKSTKSKKNKKQNKRCKVESNWDDAVIVPDSFMTAVDDSSSLSRTRRSVAMEEHSRKDAASSPNGLSRFFQFGQRHQQRDTDMMDVVTKPSELTIRPNVIEDFYDICSDGSVPDTIMVAGR